MPPEALQTDYRKRELTARPVERQIRRAAARQRSCRSSALLCVHACVFLRAACGGCARDSCARACVRAHHTCEAESCVCGVVCARAGNWKLDGQTLVEIGAGYGTAPPPTSARLPPGHRDTTTACRDGRTRSCARVGVESRALNRPVMKRIQCAVSEPSGSDARNGRQLQRHHLQLRHPRRRASERASLRRIGA